MILAATAAKPAMRDAAPKPSVLVVDDDPTQRMLVGAALEGNVAVTEAENGLAGVNALERQPFDLAILDLDMPVMDGFGVIERARARPETRHLPIIVVTGRDDVVAIERAFALGATSFLCKPLNWNVFRHQVDYVFKVAQVERELRAEKDWAERMAAFGQRGLVAIEGDVARTIQAIGGLLETRERESLDQDILEIATAAARLQATLRRVADATEILTGVVEFAPEVVSASAILEEAARDLQASLGPDAASRIDIAVSGDMKIVCDRALTVRAFSEVIRNAVEFSPPESKVQVRAVQASPQRLRFEIADKGPGIPEYMFDAGIDTVLPHSPGSRAPFGIGLGVAIAKAIVNRHGGHFGILSEPGSGTEVFLTFPTPEAGIGSNDR
jgi:CheY-like chemotaxis protein